MWNNHPEYFDANNNYWWTCGPEDVLWQAADIWRAFVTLEEQQKAYEKELKEYEKAMKEYEADLARSEREDEESTENLFSMAFNQKQSKVKKVAPTMPSGFSKVPTRLIKTSTAPKVVVKKKEKVIDIDEMSEAVDFTEVDETRQPASMIFIGHVDAGKSTICGNIMYLTGMVDDRTIRAYQKEAQDKKMDSWWLAYVMDQNEEEKEKGKTVEVGRATMDTPRIRYVIFDAPGHKNYVPNMIQGASCADFACLVISARKGEFEAGFMGDGQTREHAQLAKSLGV